MKRALVALGLAVLAACGSPAAPTARSAVTDAADSDQSWRRTPPAPGERVELAYPQPESHVLPNGLRVLLIRRPASVVSLSVVMRRPSSLVEVGKTGRTALATRMLTESTRRRSALQLAEAVEDLGTALTHEAGRDDCRVSLLTLRNDVAAGLELLAEVIREPAFDATEFERVRAEWLDGLRAERQSPLRLAALAGLRILLGERQGAPVGGSIPDVERLQVADLVDFYQRAFLPTNGALVVAGDVSWADLQPLAQSAFGSWRPDAPTAAAPAPAAEATSSGLRLFLQDRPGSVQSALFVTQALPSRHTDGHEVRQILSALLGGLFTSRINQNLRETHGYTYGAFSRAIATRDWGALVVATAVQTEHTADALREIRRELELAREPALGRPITDSEVQRAKADLESSLADRLQSVEGVADDVAELFALALPADDTATLSQRLARITTEQVRAEARARLTPGQLIVVVVGDRSAIEADLRGSGGTVSTADPHLFD